MIKEEILSCISKSYSTFEEYLNLIEQCDDLQIKREYGDGSYSGMLHLAISNQKWDVAEDLIKRGIDVNMQDENDCTVLHYISAKPINVDIAEKILLAGGNPNIENRWAVTPLYSLVCNNNCNWKEQKYKLLKLFMKYGGDKDYKASQKDTTPLQMAYEFADAKMIEILEGKMEKSPLAMTVKVAIEEGEIEKVKKLLNDKPNNINELASIGWWLHTAASCQQLEIAEFLIDLGVDVNFVIFKKGNALVNAAGTGNIAMMELFIQKGIEISCTLDHFNPIMAAVGRDKLEAVKYLLEKEKKMLPPQKYKELIKIMIDKADICESKDVLTYLGVIL